MELQVPHRVCAKVQKENSLQPETGNRREDFEETVRMEGSGDNRGGSLPRPHTYVGGDTAKTLGIKFHGIPERKE